MNSSFSGGFSAGKSENLPHYYSRLTENVPSPTVKLPICFVLMREDSFFTSSTSHELHFRKGTECWWWENRDYIIIYTQTKHSIGQKKPLLFRWLCPHSTKCTSAAYCVPAIVVWCVIKHVQGAFDFFCFTVGSGEFRRPVLCCTVAFLIFFLLDKDDLTYSKGTKLTGQICLLIFFMYESQKYLNTCLY